MPPVAACRFSTASSYTPALLPSPGAHSDETSSGVQLRSPIGLLLTCGPWMEQGPLGLNPELRTPPLPATHVRAGTGHRAQARNYTTDKVGPPICEFTRYVRPRVATSSGSSPPTISPTSWNDSTDTKKSRPQTAPNRRQPDPRRTYKPDH